MKIITFKIIILLFIVFLIDNLFSAVLTNGLYKSFGFDKKAKVLFIGHSRTDLGIDERIVEENLKIPVAKYATGGANVYDRYAMIQNYLYHNKNSVKYIVYDIDYATFSPPNELSTNSYRRLYPFMDTPVITSFLKRSAQDDEEYYSRKVLKLLRFDVDMINLSVKTLRGKGRSVFFDKLTSNEINAFSRNAVESDKSFSEESYKCLMDTIEYAHKNSAKVIFLKSPLPDFVVKHYYKNDRITEDIIRKLSNIDPDIAIVDLTELFSNEYDYFKDIKHLNRYGQIEYSKIVSQHLTDIIQSGF